VWSDIGWEKVLDFAIRADNAGGEAVDGKDGGDYADGFWFGECDRTGQHQNQSGVETPHTGTWRN
jgi:hypothetical protein